MPVLLKPDVVDASVHNSIEDWNKVREFGIRGIIHKATEGVGFVDRKYRERKDAVRRAGMLFGAYHFMNAAPAAAQAKHFLKTIGYDDKMLICLDWEPYGKNTASLASAKEFLRIMYEETGQRPVLYSGNLVKEQGRGDPFLCQHRLWLAQYAPRYQLPRGWDKYWLWQFGGDGHNHPGIIPGISTRGMDVNLFGGDNLEAEWAGRPQDRRPAPLPEPAPDYQQPNNDLEPVMPNDIPEDAVALAPTGGTSRGDAGDEAKTFASRVTNVTTNAAAINELADQGSRIASVIRSFKQLFWKSAATVTAGGTVAVQAGVTEKGNGAVIHAWISAHPITFALLLSGLLAVVFYFAIKRIEKYLVTAYNAGRYVTKGE